MMTDERVAGCSSRSQTAKATFPRSRLVVVMVPQQSRSEAGSAHAER